MKKINYAKSDYVYSSLPVSRKEEFKDVMKNNFRMLLRNGFSLLLFALPLIAFNIFMDIYHLPMTLEHFSQDELKDMLFLWEIIRLLGSVGLLFVLLIAVAGALRINKLLVWQEGISYIAEFKKGIKENYKRFAIYLLIYSLIFIATFVLSNLFGGGILFLVLLIIYILFFVSIMIWKFMISNVYDSTFKSTRIVAYNSYVKHILISMLFSLLVASPLFVNLYISIDGVTAIIIKNIIVIVLLIIYYPILLLVNSLFTISVFDKEINFEDYPDYYLKGLYKVEEAKKNEKAK